MTNPKLALPQTSQQYETISFLSYEQRRHVKTLELIYPQFVNQYCQERNIQPEKHRDDTSDSTVAI